MKPIALRDVCAWDWALLLVAVILAAVAGFNGIPLGLQVLDARQAVTRAAAAQPDAASCRPVTAHLSTVRDEWGTHFSFVARLENYRGEWIREVRGPDGRTPCPNREPVPRWELDRPDSILLVDPYIPTFAELYPVLGEYKVTVTFPLASGVELTTSYTINKVPGRKLQRGKPRFKNLPGDEFP